MPGGVECQLMDCLDSPFRGNCVLLSCLKRAHTGIKCHLIAQPFYRHWIVDRDLFKTLPIRLPIHISNIVDGKSRICCVTIGIERDMTCNTIIRSLLDRIDNCLAKRSRSTGIPCVFWWVYTFVKRGFDGL